MSLVASNYTFSPRVLQRWAQSNLSFTPTGDDGSGRAVFRFHGSTCGNIDFDLLYHVSVGSAAEGWPILHQHCEPASPHGGHTKMCCWLENAETVQAWMTEDIPVSGQPLAASLTWHPTTSASGCHATGRLHKWNAVLQSLHFHLSSHH